MWLRLWRHWRIWHHYCSERCRVGRVIHDLPEF
jgi:hypothetical protein